jgi:hypothetical protein
LKLFDCTKAEVEGIEAEQDMFQLRSDVELPFVAVLALEHPDTSPKYSRRYEQGIKIKGT